MLPDLPDLGLLVIMLLGGAGVGILCLALMMVGGLMLARRVAERLPVRPEGAPLPIRRPSTRTVPRLGRHPAQEDGQEDAQEAQGTAERAA